MNTLIRRVALSLLTAGLGCLAMSAVHAATIEVEVEGDSLVAEVDLGSGIALDITLAFDDAIGLSESSAGLGVQLLDANALLDIASRLPNTLTSVPAAFPVLITIEPPDDGGLTFVDTARIEIHTHNLTMVTNTPLRLFKAPLGGQFQDITESVGAGSVRSRGRVGGFSQFLVVADLRTHDTVADLKFDALEDRVDDPSLSATLQSALEAHLAAARADFDNGELLDAIDHVDDFIDAVDDNAGTGIANVWRASRDLDNLAGDLIARAVSLRFTLRMANSLL